MFAYLIKFITGEITSYLYFLATHFVTDVRLLNKYIAADIENYIDIAMNTVNKFCNKKWDCYSKHKNYDNTLVIADITIEI